MPIQFCRHRSAFFLYHRHSYTEGCISSVGFNVLPMDATTCKYIYILFYSILFYSILWTAEILPQNSQAPRPLVEGPSLRERCCPQEQRVWSFFSFVFYTVFLWTYVFSSLPPFFCFSILECSEKTIRQMYTCLPLKTTTVIIRVVLKELKHKGVNSKKQYES